MPGASTASRKPRRPQTAIFTDPDINAVVVATRHDSHAQQVCQALDAGKAVFVEKPLALTLEELAQVEAAYASALAGRANAVSDGWL